VKELKEEQFLKAIYISFVDDERQNGKKGK
jgi:hypothetical protein